MRSMSQCFNMVYLAGGFAHALHNMLHVAEREPLGVAVCWLAKAAASPACGRRMTIFTASAWVRLTVISKALRGKSIQRAMRDRQIIPTNCVAAWLRVIHQRCCGR